MFHNRIHVCRRLNIATPSDILSSTLSGGGIVSALPTKVGGALGIATNGTDSICWALYSKFRFHCTLERDIGLSVISSGTRHGTSL